MTSACGRARRRWRKLYDAIEELRAGRALTHPAVARTPPGVPTRDADVYDSGDMPTGPRGIALGLRAVRTLASSDVLDRLGMRDGRARALPRHARRLPRGRHRRPHVHAREAERQARAAARARAGLFDLTPTDEQQMLSEALRDVRGRAAAPGRAGGRRRVRGAAELLARGGRARASRCSACRRSSAAPMTERSAVTAVLAAEALAHGDMGLAVVAARARRRRHRARAAWATRDQQATYLPAFTGDAPAAAALALLEPRPAVRPVRARDDRAPGRRRLVARRREGARPARRDGRAAARRGARLEARPGAVRRRAGAPTGVAVAARARDGRARRGDRRRRASRRPRARATRCSCGGDPADYARCVRRARLGWCALAVGCAQAVLDHVIPYVNERKAFGEPISHRQAVAFAVADIAIELEGMRLVDLRARRAARRRRGDAARGRARAARCAPTRGCRIGSQGVQLLGGHGYVKEYPVERWYRDLRAAGVMEGAVLV